MKNILLAIYVFYLVGCTSSHPRTYPISQTKQQQTLPNQQLPIQPPPKYTCDELLKPLPPSKPCSETLDTNPQTQNSQSKACDEKSRERTRMLQQQAIEQLRCSRELRNSVEKILRTPIGDNK